MIDINEINKERDKILEQLSNPELISNPKKFEELLREKNYYEEIIEKYKELEAIKQQLEESKEIIAAERDSELLSLAEEEIRTLSQNEATISNELETLIKDRPRIETQEEREDGKEEKKEELKALIMEIRAGTGGEEAALFSKDLFTMYSKYAESQGWRQKILDSHPSDLKGFKEIIFELKGERVFSKMKYEAGVHRVQRIPTTEKSGRVHTSTATVVILPKPKKAKAQIRPEDLKIDCYRASGPGGQYVNRRETAIRITHLPTGIVTTCQTERNQLKNKENALAILEAKILEKKTQEETGARGETRKTQIAGAKRAEKIRTYNFPQDRLTDHRAKKTWRNMEKIMEGHMDVVIKDMEKSNVAE